MTGEPCRICHREAFTSDAEGPVHPCCARWAVLAPGEPCPSCSASRANAARQGRRRRAAAAEPKPRKPRKRSSKAAAS